MQKIFSRQIGETISPALFVFTILFLAVATGWAQTPAPTPSDKRDLGLQPNQQSSSQTDQTKAKEAKPELVLQTGYNNFFGPTRLGFSPDGRLLATATFHTNTIKLWETATGRELRNLSAGGQNTSSLSPVFAFSPDSRLLAAAGGSNSVKVWEVSSGREVQTLAGGQASFMGSFGVTYVAFSADGKKLVTISDAIRVWDTSSWRETLTLQIGDISAGGLTGGTGGVALSADGNQLARVNADQIKFIDLVSGRETRAIDLPDKQFDSVELIFATDGHLLVAGINEKKLKVWDMTSKSERVQAPTQKDFSFIKFSSDGRLIALCENYTIKIWEVATGRALPPLNVPNTGVFVEYGGVFANFSQDGKKLATGGFGTQTFLWETDTGRQLQQMKGRTNMAYAVAFSADGGQLTSGGRTRWDLRTGQGRRLTSQTSDKLFGMPSPDGKLIAMFAPNIPTITIYDATNGKTLQTLTRANTTDGVEKVYFSPDGRLLAVSYMQSQGTKMIGQLPSSELRIWDVSAGREIQTLTLSSSPAEAGFSSDGRVLATVAMQGEISLWDVASGKRLQTLTTAPGQSSNPFGSLGTMPNMGNIKPGQIPNIQNMPNMPNMADISAMMTNVMGSLAAGTNGRAVTSVSFSQDGKMLASGGIESKSNFDMASMMGQATGNQKRPKNQPTPDPNNIMKDLKVETTGQIVLWNPATGQQIGTIKGHGKGISDVVFSRDARIIASAGTDNTIKIWDVGTSASCGP